MPFRCRLGSESHVRFCGNKCFDLIALVVLSLFPAFPFPGTGFGQLVAEPVMPLATDVFPQAFQMDEMDEEDDEATPRDPSPSRSAGLEVWKRSRCDSERFSWADGWRCSECVSTDFYTTAVKPRGVTLDMVFGTTFRVLLEVLSRTRFRMRLQTA